MTDALVLVDSNSLCFETKSSTPPESILPIIKQTQTENQFYIMKYRLSIVYLPSLSDVCSVLLLHLPASVIHSTLVLFLLSLVVSDLDELIIMVLINLFLCFQKVTPLLSYAIYTKMFYKVHCRQQVKLSPHNRSGVSRQSSSFRLQPDLHLYWCSYIPLI